MTKDRNAKGSGPIRDLAPRRLLALVSKPQNISPSQRYRLEQWAPRLERDHGIALDFVPFESERLSEILSEPGHIIEKAALVLQDFVRRSGVVSRAKRYDAVIVHREAALIGPAFYERAIRRTGVPLIFDFDDSIWSTEQAMDHGIFSRLHFFGKTSTLCRIAAACTPGNSFLAAYARSRNPNTFIVPTSIELNEYPPLPEPSSERPFTVGWTGSASTLRHFEVARGALEQLGSQLPLRVKVICSRPPDRPIANAENLFVKWRPEDESAEVADCHVGIMPLPDDEATRGKCGLKALQYMATGRPVVASPVGVNSQIIDDGRSGFLANNNVQFVDALSRLAKSPDLRTQFGRAGREIVAERYSAAGAAEKFANVVRFVTDGAPAPSESAN